MKLMLQKITDRIYANTEGLTGGNVGVILLKDGAVAVDAQYPGSAREFREAIEELNRGNITHLLLTHYHGDHVFGAQVFEDCEIVGHRLLKAKMEQMLKTDWASGNLAKMIESMKSRSPERAFLYDGVRIVLPTKTFEDRFTLSDGQISVQMVHTGGHTAESCVIYIPEEKALFAGDLLFAKTFPYAGDDSADPDLWIAAFEKMLETDVDVIIPGHGPLSDKAEVEKQLNFFRVVRDEMKRLIRSGAAPEEVVQYGWAPPYPAARERWESALRQWYKVWKARI